MLPYLIWLLCLHWFCLAHSARILFIPAHDAASHTKSMYPAGEAFVRAGHEVHFLQLINNKHEECHGKKGVIDRIIRVGHDQETESSDTLVGVSKIMWTKFVVGSFGVIFPWKMTTEACVGILSREKTRKEFFEIISEAWDAIFIDDFFAPCGLLPIKQWIDRGITIVDFSTTLLVPKSVYHHGVVTPWSTMASFQIPTYDPGHFWYRFLVAADLILYDIVECLLNYLIPYWGSGMWPDDVSPDLLARKSSFAVSSITTGIDFVEAISSTVHSIDLACPKVEPVSEPFKTFIEDPDSRGTILFAMGHYADWTYAPPEAIPAFVEAFANLTQYRIIWQFVSRSDRPANVTSNVLMQSWVPQVAILNHPSTKLFISHMGLKSMRECICARVPAVAMPMFADQYRNTAISRHRQFAGFIDKTNLTAEIVYETLQRALIDQHYAASVHRLQDQLSDRIKDPLDLLSFHLEFTLRRKDERLRNSYLRPKQNKLPSLTQWWQADLALPMIAIGAIFYKMFL